MTTTSRLGCYVDSSSTFADWNANSSGILILPVGSLEQHSRHLPLDSDTRIAEHFARVLAREFSAALLPPLSICTSYEHRGFRGSFSFRPETVTAVLRDIAEEARRQHFTVLILVNCHGGNFILAPAAREINSLDGPLKIILAFPPGFSKRAKGELHAGEIESSLMAHLYPELVQDKRIDMESKAWERGDFQKEDLNSFGIGHIAPSGAVGYPSRARAGLGKKLEQEIREGVLTWVRERVRRLRLQPAYQAGGGITLRRLEKGDIPRCMELKTAAGWNQTPEDWETLLRLRPRGCFAAIVNGQIAGTVTTTGYGKSMAWIGMLLVDPAFRRRGIGTKLLETALRETGEFPAVGLDATAQGLPLYEKHGFQCVSTLFRLVRGADQQDPVEFTLPGKVRILKTGDIERLEALDRRAFGVSRRQLIKEWYRLAPEKALLAETDSGEVIGYCLTRPGTTAWQIGPLAAQDRETARLLLQHILTFLPENTVFLDVPADREKWQEDLSQHGFYRSREFVRMGRTVEGPIKPGVMEWAIAAPEAG